ncbi:MAG: hypothetical protein BWY38_03113 [Ignavibacteria bacterium ADurb.Bin266]|nr:MAG: hypothetical protein BWY38_03113 [Ignavibacteria bacterium ADurb.Bin266]
MGVITPTQISSIFDNSQRNKITTSVSVPWAGKFVYNCVLTFPAGTWISTFYMCTTFDTSISYNGGPHIDRSGTTILWDGETTFRIRYFNINDFVSTISFGTLRYAISGGTYHIYYLSALGNSDSGLRVRGRDNKVYWVGTDPNSNIKIRNKSGQIVGLDYGSTSDGRASPCRIRMKNGSVVALRWIKIV